ncbi:GTPase [Brevibacillus fulvus]|uniref:GTP-binding protein EngB required for normal cell division n=1 Tax=Brevibacillus fulvus TaxID=1125967 RepID=A0A938XW11_9BACL|nr:GTPase [Brevibacillus fulvus]MBM7589134.1 GTP-binding protein EngB required for normal cell division [Brevibacillus fulvus]
MMESKIRDYKNELQQYLLELKPIYERQQLQERYAELEKEITAQLEKYQPSLMFYGIYNAGKSSLLNAIFAEAIAPVGDIPTTSEITAYKWNGYDLIDTPGINGPERDYKLSKSELVKHDVILFVIDDSDSFDNKLVAEEITQIMLAGKPLIVVLNNKQASLDSERIQQVRSKLYANIQSVATEQQLDEVDKRYSFITVNALSGYNGKANEKALLVERSHVQDLERLILQKLKEQAGARLLLPTVDILIQRIPSLQRSLQQQFSSEEEKKLLELIQDIYEKKNTFVQTLQLQIKQEFQQAFQPLYQLASNGQEIDSAVKQLHQRINDKVNQELEAVLSDVTGDLERFYEKLTVAEGSIILNRPADRFISAQQTNALEGAGDKQPQPTVDKIITTAIEKTVVTSLAKETLLKTVETGTKGLIKTTVGKTVMKQLGLKSLVPVIAPVLPVIEVIVLFSVLKDIVSLFQNQGSNDEQKREMEYRAQEANRQQQEALASRINAMQEIRMQLQIQLQKMEENVLTTIQQGTQTIFDNIVAEVKADLQLVEQKNAELEHSLNQLQQFLSNLALLKGQLA